MAEPCLALPDPRTMMRTEASDEKGAIYLRCPQSLPPAIRRAAQLRMTSSSSYVRAAVLDRLKADGINPFDTAPEIEGAD